MFVETHEDHLRTWDRLLGIDPTITEEKTLVRRPADALFVMIGARARTDWLPEAAPRDVNGFVCTGQDIPQWSQHRAGFPLETNLPGTFCGATCDTVPSSEFQAESMKEA